MFRILQVEDSHRQLIPLLIIVVLCWEVTKYLLRMIFGGGSKKPGAGIQQQNQIDANDYPEFEIPSHPHVEFAMDPPTGIHLSNSLDPYSFDNDFASGKYLYFHPPTGPGDNSVYADYFKGKKRRWELRIQFKFKQAPKTDADLCFGIEMEDYMPMSSATKHVVSVAAAAIRSAVGGLYQSQGDDPDVCSGELEKPQCVLPLWAFDQFVVTPPGQEPPSLQDPSFPDMGQKRFKRISAFCSELEAVKQKFDTESTYTFAFWGNSRFLDVINWQLLGIPMITPLGFDKLAKRPPVYAVLYNLRPDPEDVAKGRHLPSRKQYYFRAAVWSSLHRPEKKRFEALTGSSLTPLTTSKAQRGKISLRRRVRSIVVGSFACCTSRTLGPEAETPRGRNDN